MHRARSRLVPAIAALALLAAWPGASEGQPSGVSRGAAVETPADGWLDDGETLSPFATGEPAIDGLDDALRDALRAAATAAETDGVEVRVSSGWRSSALQAWLLERAVVTYGSEEEARRWVNTPELSTHVSGKAVDVAFTDAMSWFSQHGSDYGLCQTYGNEMWHYELAVEPGGTCPPRLTDAGAG